jgi:hypothetical protein
MPIVFEEVIANVAPEPRLSPTPMAESADQPAVAEPLSALLRREEQRLERLRAD